MSRDDLYERYLSEAERFLKSEASTAQLVKQECDRESTSARNMAGKKKAEIDRLAHQAQEAFSQLSKRLAGSHAKDVGAALPNMVRPIASNEDAAELASSLSGLIKKIDCYIEMIEKDLQMHWMLDGRLLTGSVFWWKKRRRCRILFPLKPRSRKAAAFLRRRFYARAVLG